jgi:cyanophycinase
MTGSILLGGGGEFQKGFETADKAALQLAGGSHTPLIVMTLLADSVAASQRATVATTWLTKLGAANITSCLVNSKTDANQADLLEKIALAKLIYLAGDDANFILTTLKGSLVWEAILGSWANGTLLATSSAAAMALGEFVYTTTTTTTTAKVELWSGLGLLPNTIVVPQHNLNERTWVQKIQATQPEALVLGIDEHAAVLGNDNEWRGYGRGWVTVYQQAKPAKYVTGQPFKLSNK